MSEAKKPCMKLIKVLMDKSKYRQFNTCYHARVTNLTLSIWSEDSELLGKLCFNDIINVETLFIDKETNKVKFLKIKHNNYSGYIFAFIKGIETTEEYNKKEKEEVSDEPLC